jgi:uncharacterized protein with NAD-binding domain and iron-sulfur cluster
VAAAPPVANKEPLLINTVESWAKRPEAVVPGIGNLFLASDYVRTNTNLATMEGANEAARRAVNGILAAAGSTAERCCVWRLSEPKVFEPLKRIDPEERAPPVGCRFFLPAAGWNLRLWCRK